MTRQQKYVLSRAGFYILLAVIAFYLVFPFYWAFRSSITPDNQLFTTPVSYFPATPTTGNYQLTGLDDGTYQFSTWLPGFELDPFGPATVSGGSGTLNITFRELSGIVTGNITLPGVNADYNNVQIDLTPMQFFGGMTQPTAAIVGNASQEMESLV